MPEPTTSGLTDGEWLALHRMADEAEELRAEVRQLRAEARRLRDGIARHKVRKKHPETCQMAGKYGCLDVDMRLWSLIGGNDD